MCYTTFSVGLKDMEKIQQMTYDKAKIKSELEDAVYTWLTTLEMEPNRCMSYMVSDSGPLHDRDDHDVSRLCKMLFRKLDEHLMYEAAEAVGSVRNDEIYDFGPEC